MSLTMTLSYLKIRDIWKNTKQQAFILIGKVEGSDECQLDSQGETYIGFGRRYQNNTNIGKMNVKNNGPFGYRQIVVAPFNFIQLSKPC